MPRISFRNQQLASIYVRYYPLFQEAYEELGYPGRYFNDRVIEIIDHLLQTPDIVEPIFILNSRFTDYETGIRAVCK